MNIKLYGVYFVVPFLVVPGQKDDIILGSTVIKHLIQDIKSSSNYWDLASRQKYLFNPDIQHILSTFTG